MLGLPAGDHDRGKARGRLARSGFAFPRNFGEQENHVVPRARICRAGPARVRSGFAWTRAHTGAVFSGASGTVRGGTTARTDFTRSYRCQTYDSCRTFDGRGYRGAVRFPRSRYGLDRHLAGAHAGSARSDSGKVAFQGSAGTSTRFARDGWLARTGVDARQCRRSGCLATRCDFEISGNSRRVARQRSFQRGRDARFTELGGTSPTFGSDCGVAFSSAAYRSPGRLRRHPADRRTFSTGSFWKKHGHRTRRDWHRNRHATTCTGICGWLLSDRDSLAILDSVEKDRAFSGGLSCQFPAPSWGSADLHPLEFRAGGTCEFPSPLARGVIRRTRATATRHRVV